MKLKYILVLALLISFGSIGAVSFTPGLPNISSYFAITSHKTEYTVTWYMFGYAVGQLLYGPLTNRFGSKVAIIVGSLVAVLGSAGCILAYFFHSFILLLAARLIMALGAACGLKMTFTLSSKLFNYEESARVMGLLTIAFAITPGLGVFIGGILVSSFNWSGPFYLMLFYGLVILAANNLLPEVHADKDPNALNFKQLVKGYAKELNNTSVIYGGLLVGLGSCIVYTFATLAPFIVMSFMHLTPSTYGAYNFLPSVGILAGSLFSSYLGKIWLPHKSLQFGLMISFIGAILLFLGLYDDNSVAINLFLPMAIIYFGLSFVFGNSAALALRHSEDKSTASALMSFLNMGSAVLVVFILGLVKITQPLVLPVIYVVLLSLGVIWYKALIWHSQSIS